MSVTGLGEPRAADLAQLPAAPAAQLESQLKTDWMVIWKMHEKDRAGLELQVPADGWKTFEQPEDNVKMMLR